MAVLSGNCFCFQRSLTESPDRLQLFQRQSVSCYFIVKQQEIIALHQCSSPVAGFIVTVRFAARGARK